MKIYNGQGDNNFDVDRFGKEVHVTLNYPNIAAETECVYVVVDQSSLRASDGLRLHYDYERDGFVIEQASTFSWDADDEVCDHDWQEVSFVKSWEREKEEVK